MKWYELTSPEIGKLNRDMPVVIPLGSCEQHGRHLPLFVDTIQIEEIVGRLEARMTERIIVLPVLWLGASHHHMDFPGTLSLPPSAYAAMIQDLTRCLLHHGFRRLLFLNGHGGNIVPVSQALTDLIATDDRADAATLALASWFVLAAEAMNAENHGMTTPCLTHACEYETSLMLAIREDLVKLAEISPEHQEVPRPWVANPHWLRKVEGFHRFHRWTSTGHMGNPAAATAEKGRSLLDAMTEEIILFVDEFAKWPTMKKLTNLS